MECTTHRLKTWPEFFREIRSGRKTFEIRRADRVFQVGDVLQLAEFDPSPDGGFTGRTETRRVTYVVDLGPIGCPGFVAMSLVRVG